MHQDVIVIGVGAAGAQTAWRLAEQGAAVVGLEGRELLHTRGSYAGESRLFRAAYHEGAEYVPLLMESRRQWQELHEMAARQVFLETGVLSIGAASAPQMAQVQESLQHADLEHEVLSTGELTSRFPQHSRITDEIGVLDRLGGVLRPESAVAEIQRQAMISGADLRDRSPVVSLHEAPDHIAVHLRDGEQLTAERVVVTAGVHTPALIPDLAPHLAIRPISLTWFCPENPAGFTPEAFPAFIRDLDDVHLFGVPSLDGTLVKAGYDAKFGTIGSPEDLPLALDESQRGRIATDVHRLVSGLPPYLARESMHMDIYTQDKRPVLGPVSDRVVVGTGYSGHGFKLSPAFGNALADFAVGRTPRHDLSAFSPQRFTR